MTHDEFAKKHNLTITADRLHERTDGTDWDKHARHWRCTIATPDGRSHALEFTQGSAYTAPPTIADVLECVALDAAGVENAKGFEDWAAEYGFDTDGRKAERTYKACLAQTAAFELLLGLDAMHELMFETEEA